MLSVDFIPEQATRRPRPVHQAKQSTAIRTVLLIYSFGYGACSADDQRRQQEGGQRIRTRKLTPEPGVVGHAVADAVGRRGGEMPFAMHGAQELAAQRTPDLAMAGPVEGIELHQHRDRADETGGVGDGRDLARGVLRHEVERDRIDEEGLKGYVQIAEQRHHLIERRVALVQHGIADGLQRLHAGEIEQTDSAKGSGLRLSAEYAAPAIGN